LAGIDSANPVGQVLSLAMMLRESFGLEAASTAIEIAVRRVWDSGDSTADLESPDHPITGTREMGARIAQQVQHCFEAASSDGQPHETAAHSD
jgi:3-isopropylmalate dehydrogenase